MTRDEVIAAIRKATEELGHVPSQTELLKLTKVKRGAIRRNFITYRAAMVASGPVRRGTYRLDLDTLFPDWAELVRKLEKIPTVLEYEMHGTYSVRPLIRHFGGWRHVPQGMLEYAKQEGLEATWKEVLDVVVEQLPFTRGWDSTTGRTTGPPRPRLLRDEPVYGPPMVSAPLTYAPTNEAGVVFLFGTVARELGFAVTRVQTEFPDCEAMREVQADRWQRVRIEFEYESRNFLAHLHPVDKCDLIVCWNHNWQECPLEVLELKTAMKGIAGTG